MYGMMSCDVLYMFDWLIIQPGSVQLTQTGDWLSILSKYRLSLTIDGGFIRIVTVKHAYSTWIEDNYHI